MAARANKQEKRFYVYAIKDGDAFLYVGKGTRSRFATQKKRFSCDGLILEDALTEVAAYAAEIKWMEILKPTENKIRGGTGGWSSPLPSQAICKDYKKFLLELETAGTRRYVARFLLSKLSNDNCERYGVSKVGLFRLREVANGSRC